MRYFFLGLLFLIFAAAVGCCHFFVFFILVTSHINRSPYLLTELLLNPVKSWEVYLINFIALLATVACLNCIMKAMEEGVRYKPHKMFTIATLITLCINVVTVLLVTSR